MIESNWRPQSFFYIYLQLLSYRQSFVQCTFSFVLETYTLLLLSLFAVYRLAQSFIVYWLEDRVDEADLSSMRLVISQVLTSLGCRLTYNGVLYLPIMRIFLRLVSILCLTNLVILVDQVYIVLPMLRRVDGSLLLIRSYHNYTADFNSQLIISLISLQSKGRMNEQQIVEQSAQQQVLSPTQSKNRQIEVYEFQVSGKTPKYIDKASGFIYKNFSPSQFQFYKYINSLNTIQEGYALKKFIPRFFAVQTQDQLGHLPTFRKDSDNSSNRNIWIDHIASRKSQENRQNKQFLCLQNTTFRFDVPSIIDLKLGIKKHKKSNSKFSVTTTDTHKFRINGQMVAFRKQTVFEQHFVSKYFGQGISVQQTALYLSLFFFDGQKINMTLLNHVISDLRQLILCFKKMKGVKFISSSLFIAYDSANPQKYTVNLIDFDKYEMGRWEQDTLICEGLINIHTFFLEIIEKRQTLQTSLRNRELLIFKEEARAVVPQHKIDEYSK